MDNLKMQTKNLADDNFLALAAMFPNAVTETIDENGEVIRAIDADVLAQEINTKVVSGKEERYQFTWPDKKKSLLMANAPIAATLRPCKEESVNFDTTANLYIEGDNLDVLKLLGETYLNSVKMIYIDPPYNTGKDFIYKDNFSQSREEYLSNSGQFDEEGNRLVKNLNSNGRYHTDWLNMMYPRLTHARNLLRDDGVIFISIDDYEVVNLRKVCDDIFGESNFIEFFITRSNPRGNQAKKFTASEHDFILCYSKSISNILPLGHIKNISEFNKQDENGRFREIGLRKRGAGARREDAPNQYYPIFYNELKNKISIEQKESYNIEIIPKLSDGSDGRWRWAKKTVNELQNQLLVRKVKRGNIHEYDIFEKDYYSEDKISKIKSIFSAKEFNQENATEELKYLFDNKKLFDYPKPVYTIYHLLSAVKYSEGDVIIDFFSGSATTAHAVMQLNAEDNGNRKYIMVQLPEECDESSEAFKAGYKNICEIGKERIRRAGAKIKEENKDKEGIENLDTGFRVLKLDSSNMKEVYYTPAEYAKMGFNLDGFKDNIKPDRSEEDLLFQVMLDLGIPLSAKVRQEGKVFYVNDNYLIACFDKVDTDTITEIAKKQPYYSVFRDSSFLNDAALVNVEQVFRTYSPSTIRRVL